MSCKMAGETVAHDMERHEQQLRQSATLAAAEQQSKRAITLGCTHAHGRRASLGMRAHSTEASLGVHACLSPPIQVFQDHICIESTQISSKTFGCHAMPCQVHAWWYQMHPLIPNGVHIQQQEATAFAMPACEGLSLTAVDGSRVQPSRHCTATLGMPCQQAHLQRVANCCPLKHPPRAAEHIQRLAGAPDGQQNQRSIALQCSRSRLHAKQHIAEPRVL
eukprot:GHRQ01031993.1.p1 GENE.GHRQ01031993.1~~GHRQ01031993.1.p1  ORF type:complete len:220 (+),score=28.33 GHRQ01031993.1:611-1270(+)